MSEEQAESRTGRSLIPVEERRVEFYGDELTAALVQDGERQEIYVPVKPLCDALGLDWSSQYKRIQRDLVLSKYARLMVIMTINPQGGRPDALCLPLKFIPGWLFGVTPGKVRPELREKILRYQAECYDVLFEAFQTGRLTRPDDDLLQGDSPAVQAYHLARAVADIARNQVLMEARLAGRLDDHERRLEQVEAILGNPERFVTPDQASQISQAVKAVALALGKKSGRNEHGSVYGELYRKFGLTSYKMVPSRRFQEVMDWLTDWHEEQSGQRRLLK